MPPGRAAEHVVPTREAILDCLRAAQMPLTLAQLAEQLRLAPERQEALNRRVLAMERDGQLLPNRKGVLLLASKLDLVAGRVIGHRDGFGFLVPDHGGADIFLNPREMQKVMHRDRVLAKRTGFDRRGRPEGAIVEVTERVNRRLVGRLLAERGVMVVVPEDQRIKHDILVQPGETLKAQPGQVVTVEIVEQPSGYTQPIGRVVEVLGDIDDPGMEIEIAVRKFDVPHRFPDQTLTSARGLPSEVAEADLAERVDLRDIALVTIDGEDARDFDDAVYCEPCEIGRGKAAARAPGWRLLVAIADVSHYVLPDDAIDREAALRSTSVYFPRRVIPMLPEKLSNGLCSLNPNVDRLVLVCDMVIDAQGATRGYQFYPGVMHSAARLTYDEVWGILSGRDAPGARRRAELVPQLQHLYELYRVLARARLERGAVEFDTVETRIVCDPAGRIERIVPYLRNDAHRLIEECMLAANVCAADFMHRHRHPGLYRVHEGPTPERLARLREFLGTLGITLGGGDSPSSRDYSELAARVRERADATLLHTMMLRSMQQAIYSPHNSGHFGLAYEAYAHFTSPIRRYPDLMTHRVIKQLLARDKFEPPPLAEGWGAGAGDDVSAELPARGAARARAIMARWEQYGMLCSVNERRADEAARDVEAWLKSQYMRGRVGEQYPGRITGVAPFGVFVTLDELFVEGLVHVSELGNDYFQYSEAAHELRGERTGRRFRLTDPIDVQVSRVDLEARRIEFRLVSRREAIGLPPEPVRPRAGKRAKPKTEQVEKVQAARREARKRTRAPQSTSRRRGRGAGG